MTNITVDEIKETLNRSGYLLENRVLEFFLRNDYWVESNHRYLADGLEEKFREMDILAMQPIAVSENDRYHISFYLHYFVECINNPVPLAVFRSHGDHEQPTSDWSYQFQNGSENLLEQFSLKFRNAISELEREIINVNPARQYCSFQEKKNKDANNRWMAYHPDDLHKTLVKLSQFVKEKKQETFERWEGVQPEYTRLEMFIPLIVLQGEIIEIANKDDLEINQVNYYRLKTPFENSHNKSVSVDIVTESYLQSYLDKKIKGLMKMFDRLNDAL